MWLLMIAFLLFVTGAVFWLIKQELFNRNPHFTVQIIDIQVHGDTSEREIERRLPEAGIRRDQTNLFDINLAELRRSINQWREVPSKQIIFQKRLPDTLGITIFEREPVAQLRSSSGPLIDTEGILLPPRGNRSRRTLPLITPVRKNAIPNFGGVVEDEGVNSALSLLQQIAQTPEYNRLFDIDLIQLDFPGPDKMLLHLRHQGPFVAGAQIVMPLREHELPMALARVEAIAFDRLEAQQITGFIDGSIRQNIPVLNYPRF